MKSNLTKIVGNIIMHCHKYFDGTVDTNWVNLRLTKSQSECLFHILHGTQDEAADDAS